MTKQPASGWSIVGASMLLLAVLLAIYASGYFLLLEQESTPLFLRGPGLRVRVYKYEWIAMAYKPIAPIEAAVIGNEVMTFGIVDYSGRVTPKPRRFR